MISLAMELMWGILQKLAIKENMFRVSSEDLILVYCIIIVVLVAGLWIANEVKRATPKSDLSSDRLCRCRDCSHIYIVSRYETMSRCPQCTTVNHITDRSKI